MAKCTVDSENHITGIWLDDDLAPAHALACDQPKILITGNHLNEAHELRYHFKLVAGKCVETEEGTAYFAQAYFRDREEEYPSLEDVTVALAEKAEGDSTMWDEVTAKRAAIKTKWPKDNSGPV